MTAASEFVPGAARPTPNIAIRLALPDTASAVSHQDSSGALTNDPAATPSAYLGGVTPAAPCLARVPANAACPADGGPLLGATTADLRALFSLIALRVRSGTRHSPDTAT